GAITYIVRMATILLSIKPEYVRRILEEAKMLYYGIKTPPQSFVYVGLTMQIASWVTLVGVNLI
ncbi:MAG: hypothetical protein MJZ76_10525, partial [Bacteroidales bacterium]|nr:hypothetical protein [Bacteroidales bacterium]